MRFVKVENDNANGDLDEAAYQQFLTGLPDLIMRNLGSVWLIGNEPDRKKYQDDLTPEKYAERFFEVATIIKNFDPNAKIGFGSVVQPTPIRIRYLEKSLARLSELAGNRETALSMIDIWSIHAFILTEIGTWGADIPPGFDCDVISCDDAILITDYSDTYSIDIFIDRIQYFRNWLNSIGQREKPLWITEYGSLFYYWEVLCSINSGYDCQNPDNGWPTELDTIEFMVDTFNFLLQSKDENLGNPNDEDKLVQRWYWYSLNDRLDSFGGSLFDPENDKQITELGKAYKRYIEFLIFPKTYLPIIFK
jgi:hypothetical protein